MNDYLLESTVIDTFSTRSFSTGAPFALAGTPALSVYEDLGLVEITAGVTLTESLDGRAGFNGYSIAATAANGYENGKTYSVVITAGTVDGVSVVNEVVAHFSIGRGVSITALDNDASAAANIAAQYDGTGITGDNFPSTQSQIGKIAVGSAAISTIAESYVLATGVQSSGTVPDTETLDNVYHQHTDVAGALDLYYQFDVTGAGVGTQVFVTGRINGSNDSLDGVYAWDWIGAVWDRVGDFNGQASTIDTERPYRLLTRHTGTGANLGKVRFRFAAIAGLTTAELFIDQIAISYSVVSQSVGYSNGSIWLDTINGVAGTEPFTNGMADNPSLTWGDAVTLRSLVGVAKITVAQSSVVTLTATTDNFAIDGLDYLLNLNGQQVDSTTITGAVVSGIATGNGGSLLFERCKFVNATLPEVAIVGSALAGIITAGEAGTYFLDRCASAIAGVAAPVFDFGVVGSTNLNIRHYSGGIEILNMTALDTMSLEGDGQLIVNANCTGGLVKFAGNFTITDNAGGAVTFVDAARYDTTQVAKAVLDAAKADHVIADSIGEGITKILEDTEVTLPAAIATRMAETSIDTTAGAVDLVLVNADMRGTDGANQVAPDNASIAAILIDTSINIPLLIAALNNITAADVLAAGDIDGFSLEEALKLALASAVGKLSGGDTGNIVIRAADDSKTRISGTGDIDGNRSTVVLDVSG